MSSTDTALVEGLPVSQEPGAESIARRFRLVCLRQPDQVAILAAGAVLSYAELDASSDRVAQALRQSSLPTHAPLAVLLPQGSAILASILGCLKAGHSFVVLSPTFPEQRLQAIWEDAQSPLLLTDCEHLQQAAAVTHDPQRCLDLSTLGGENAAFEPGQPPDLDEMAALFYTSGTTGKPKGVIWSHRLVLHTASQNQAQYDLHPGDRLAVLTSFGFGAAMTMSFAALLSGATLYLADTSGSSPGALVSWLDQSQVSVLGLPPVGLLRQFMDYLTRSPATDRPGLPNLRMVLLGGQPLFRQDVSRFFAIFGSQVRLRYRLAGSETMLMSELDVRPETDYPGASVPVGFPVPDKDVLLLDEQLLPVRPGVPGEIAVRSRFLASGYWQQPELSAATFLDADEQGRRTCLTGDMGRLTPQGMLLHLGRKDNMVKVRGFRIQIEEIEAALKSLEGVQEAAVITQDQSTGDKRLVAYIYSRSQPPPTSGSLRSRLMQQLPDYMLPAIFVFLEQPLPLTATGKVDRLALPPPGRVRPALDTPYTPPGTDLEQKLAAIWTEVLEIDEVGIEDSFYGLGGDSLAALQLSLHVERLLNQSIPPDFYNHQPTISHLIKLLQDGNAPGPLAPTPQPRRRITKKTREPGNLSKLVASAMRLCYHLAAACGSGCQFYSLSASLEYKCLGWLLLAQFGSRGVQIHTQYLQQTGVSTMNASQVIQHKWMLNFWIHTWGRDLGGLTQGDFIKISRVNGLENLSRAQTAGKGVILLLTHTMFTAVLWRWMALQNLPEGVKILPRRPKGNMEVVRTNIGMLTAAEATLRQGGVVQIFADGYKGQRALTLPFLNGEREFQPGFAELALLTGAAAIPVSVFMNSHGSPVITFHPPLEPMNTRAHEAQVRNLVEQFAAFLGEEWQTHLSNIDSFQLMRLMPHAIRSRKD